MQNGLVTVVVPVYNTERYLNRCIQSIVDQTYTNMEILLIDDGSPDSCPQMCDEWAQKDSRVRVIHKKNEGLGMARNTGIENANGEYICFFDSDDYVDLVTVERAYQLAVSANAEIVVFGMNDVDRTGRVVRRAIPEAPVSCYCGEDIQTLFLPDLINGGHRNAKNKNICMSACSAIFSMELIERNNWRFVSERIIISEDSFSLMRLYRDVKRLAILPEAHYYYCKNECSLTHTYRIDRYAKIKHYYHQCLELAGQMEYCEEVYKSISGVFVAFTIATMKQIVAADISREEKHSLFWQIVYDDTLLSAMDNIASRNYGRARGVLSWVVRKRYCELCYLMIAIQNVLRK